MPGTGDQGKNWGVRQPPIIVDDDYLTWKNDIEVWQRCTDVPKEKQALIVHLSLRGRMKNASSELKPDDLEKDTGMKTLLDKLDGLHLQHKGMRQFHAFKNVWQDRRKPDTNVNDYTADFEHTLSRATKESIDLPDIVKAFALLNSCNFEEEERNLIMAGLQEITYESMKTKIQQIFGNKIGIHEKEKNIPDSGACAEKSPDVLYSRNYPNQRGRGNFRGGFSRRGRGSSNGYQARMSDQSMRGRSFRGNPRYARGKPRYQDDGCFECKAHDHWAKDCPKLAKGSRTWVADGTEEYEDDDEDYVMFTLVDTVKDNASHAVETGETVLVSSLVDDSKGCGVLDSGCTKTVCGKRWLQDYMNNLSDYERSMVKEESSPATFTFGDGVAVKSTKKLTLPCMIGGLRGKVVTDVVDCDIPLLLSKKSMKSVGMILNFKDDSVKVKNKYIKLRSTTSGHYALPMCL